MLTFTTFLNIPDHLLFVLILALLLEKTVSMFLHVFFSDDWG